MQTPYTASPVEAFTEAQLAVATALTAVVLFPSKRSALSSSLLTAAIWVATLARWWIQIAGAMGVRFDATSHPHVLAVSACLASAAVLVATPRWIVVAIAGQAALWYLTGKITGADMELEVLHVAWFGVLVGLTSGARARVPGAGSRELLSRSYLRSDLVLFALAFTLAALTSTYVLQRSCDSADEYAYTYQAAVFARFHAYGATPHCYDAFRTFWVFDKEGRLFSQYTPGWPLFMAPFVAVRLVWLAGPASLGLLVVTLARLTRRAKAAVTTDPHHGGEREVRAAGVIAAVATMLGSTMLINGGSRFPHVFVCALFAGCVEALCAVTSPLPTRRHEWVWGAVLGSGAAWLLATRPVDGGCLGTGMALYFVYALLRGRVPWRALVATLIGFAFWGGLTLVILRLQLGVWFQTGYSLTESIHPWMPFKLSVPDWTELKWAVPLATGSYCWWPLAPALGLAGLATLRRNERRVAFMLCLGVLVHLAAYGMIEYGRGADFGYGPRYAMVAIVPMAVGTGVLLGPIWSAASRRLPGGRALRWGGPAAVVITAVVIGVLRIAPFVYPYNYADVRDRNTVFVAIRAMHLTNALVWVEKGTTMSNPWDLTQNDPVDLYPVDGKPLVLYDASPEVKACVKARYPGRASYRTSGRSEVTLVPE